MTYRLTAPSKTFLAGEYAVLVGAPAILLNTSPRFELLAGPGDGQVSGIPQGSPASQWFKQRAPLIQNLNIQFIDPHEGRGGLGASGAQFLMAHELTSRLQGAEETVLADIFQDYQACGGTGSGADLLAQTVGEAAVVEVEARDATAFEWPYPEVGFAIFRTGVKLATHEHLRDLSPDYAKQLAGPAREAAAAFGADSAAAFVVKVRNYGRALRELNLQAPLTLEKLKPIEAQEWCLAAKGCGALGADTIVVLFPQDSERDAIEFAAAHGLIAVATRLSDGLEVEREAR